MRIAVLGGGLQGACVALELAMRGVAVDLYDKRAAFVTQASAQNEGKIHLGYVYANDATRSTARTMVQGALEFLPLLRRWLGTACASIPVSQPFYYAVHRQSLLRREQIEQHFADAHAILMEESRAWPLDYFGSAYHLPQRLTHAECAAFYDTRNVQAAYRTAEIGIDPEVLASLVRARLAADTNIRGFTQTQVQAIERHASSVVITVECEGQTERRNYDHVVNTTWESRLALDESAGVTPSRPWLYRVKHYLRWQSQAPPTLPSTTIVLGAYGDLVAYGNGAHYLSWYPAGMRGMSSALRPPAWPLELDETLAHEVRHGILAGLAQIIPDVKNVIQEVMAASEVKAGIIFAWGQTDIDDPTSGLHERYSIGPQSFGRYHTVDTGKLTMAPLYGRLVADRILPRH